ncbi:Endoplasmic reticulum oxidoreductin 1 [Trinorchestia longiramus]|nr:Endoplasmic reticulum oxidoreductin 1 [Trinorchestia longiramus]
MCTSNWGIHDNTGTQLLFLYWFVGQQVERRHFPLATSRRELVMSAWFSKQSAVGRNSEALESCLCQLKGLIDDCSCSVESIDNFNNVHVYPILNSLLKRDFFRYWKVNLQKPCPFWPDDGRCTMRYCSVEKCEAPPGVRMVEEEKPASNKDCTGDEHLGDLDPTISPESQAGFEVWAAHDSARDDSFCEPEDDKSSGSSYVDLLANPERYTGYAGASAHRVWSSIYGENCFSAGQDSSSSASSPFAHLSDTKGTAKDSSDEQVIGEDRNGWAWPWGEDVRVMSS